MDPSRKKARYAKYIAGNGFGPDCSSYYAVVAMWRVFVLSRYAVVPSYCARYCVGCFRCGGAGCASVNKAEARADAGGLHGWGDHCCGWVGIYRVVMAYFREYM